MKGNSFFVRLGSIIPLVKPWGYLKNETSVGSNDGTFINQELIDPWYQFFRKLMSDAGLTPNDLDEDETNGYQLIDALESKIIDLNGGLSTKIINIGDFDCTNVLHGVPVAHGLSATEWKNIRNISVIIRNDADSAYYDSNYKDPTTFEPQVLVTFGSSNVSIFIKPSGFFDSTDFNSTSYNRGWIKIEYIAD